MGNFYNRRIEILLDDEIFIAENDEKRFRDFKETRMFKITFEVTIDFGGYNSYADIAIYNLSDATLNKVLKEGKIITLKAGYDDNIDAIFIGRIRNSFKERNGPDRITRILCIGGSQPKSSINKTLGKNATIPQIIKECVGAMNYPLVINDDDFANDEKYIRGAVLYGDPNKILDDMAKRHDFSYTIENNTVICVKNNSSRRGALPVVVSEETGMQGIPEVSEVGCDVAVRLNPKIRIGGIIDVVSELRTYNFNNLYYQDIPQNAGSGVYRVFKIEHSGDTYGDNWTTKITSRR